MALSGACLIGGAALALVVQLAMLDRIEPGLWELKMRDGGRSERLCLNDGRRLIQLRHPQVALSPVRGRGRGQLGHGQVHL